VHVAENFQALKASIPCNPRTLRLAHLILQRQLLVCIVISERNTYPVSFRTVIL